MRAKRSDAVLLVLMALAIWNPQVQWPNVLPLPITGPVFRVIVIHESAQATPESAAVMGGRLPEPCERSASGGRGTRILSRMGRRFCLIRPRPCPGAPCCTATGSRTRGRCPRPRVTLLSWSRTREASSDPQRTSHHP